MCEPVSLGIMAGAAVIGGGISAFGQKQAGDAKQAIANENARIAEMAATGAETRGLQEAGLAEQKGSQVIGAAKTAYSAAGVDVSSGTPLEVLSGVRQMNQLDVDTIKANAAEEAWGYRTQSASFKAQGQLDQMAGTYGAVGTLLGAGGQAVGYGARAFKAAKAGG